MADTGLMRAARDLGLFILIAPLLVLLPTLLLLSVIDVQVFMAVGALWMLIALLLILGPETISEISFGKASIKRDVKAAENARNEAEQIRDKLSQLLKLSIENNYILISGSELAVAKHPAVKHVEKNLDEMTELLSISPEERLVWQKNMRQLMQQPIQELAPATA